MEHGTEQFACEHCGKKMSRADNKKRHERSCKGDILHVCFNCKKRCATAQGLKRHLQWHEKTKNPTSQSSKVSKPISQKTCLTQRVNSTSAQTPQYRCRRCTHVFNNRHDLYLHRRLVHYNQMGGALQLRPWEHNQMAPPWAGDDALRAVYDANAPLILEQNRLGPIHSVYNFPVTNDVNLNQLMHFAEEVYRQQQRAFRINLVFGVILQNRETNRYRYFVPYNNNGIFERPLYISRRGDLQSLRRELERKDILTELLRQRPDTKWVPVLVTNVHFVVTETYYPLGQGLLPEYLLKKDSLYPLIKNRHSGKLYKDNLCAFRCLALHLGHEIRCIDGPAILLFRQWSDLSKEDFEGLSFEDFPEFETKFSVNLEVYSLQEDGFALSVYKSRGQQPSTMYVNLYENHLSYIRDFSMYAQKYQCKTCQRHFLHAGHLHRHQNSCINKTKFVYPGGFHQATENIFHRLDTFEIHVPEGDRTFPWFVCYDFEALLQKVHDQPTDMLQWTHKHIPISVSICSNVEDHTNPLCLVDADQDQLVKSMVNHIKQIAQRVYELAVKKWGWVLATIEQRIQKDDVMLEEEDSENEMDDQPMEDNREKRQPSHPLKKIYSELEKYMSQVPVIGFNSAKYDLNLIKRCLAKHLNIHEDSEAFVVKKNNAYMCIATESLKFLDMSQYLAAGSSYAGFLKAYNVREQKGFFPYEWFDDICKLGTTCLPPREAFFSQLKGSNISDEDYSYCQTIWENNKMTTFQDFLMWYNNLDVKPFVEAVQKFQHFYFDKGIDVFKVAISVPGIARQLLFKTAKTQNVNFALFDESNKDLYQTVKRNIVGGPSIIFTRHHCAGQTLIRGQKTCRKILGFDANALYLQALGFPMSVGPFVRRRAENDFRPELRDKYMSAYYWMDWLIHAHGLPIQHKLNTGREVKIGKYPVDGYMTAYQSRDRPTVFQFHGCYWHGHLCEVTRGNKDEKWQETRTAKFQKTLETTAFLKKDHCVVELWECEFRQYCRQNREISDFIDSIRPGFFQKHKGEITSDDILDGVDSGALFGMVEVDIEVPREWPPYFQHPTMTPHQYFQEMSPLFCTTEIPFEAIGQHMQTHIRQYHLSAQPRRLLVGGMKAQQILLATTLLQWYLNHGLIVTKIYQVVEYQQQRCFLDFVKEVSDARRQGDIDPDTAIIADTSKVIGNSGYGSLIMDKSKHRQIKYVQGENETCLKVNDPLFQKLDCLDEEEQYYEVEMAKRKIKLDLPIQLGYFILQYAKLRMLEFYFDFMDVYVDRSDFEYCEMDTDSAYMAISGSCLEDVIKPEMRETFEKGLKGFCTDKDIEADTVHHWFPRTCCTKHAKFDKRTPGLFKLEYQGDEMIGLCSKTYIVRKTKVYRPSTSKRAAFHLLRRSMRLPPKRCPFTSRMQNEYKFSSKGVSKRHLKSPMAKFRTVLKSRKAQSGLNRGFRVKNNAIFTYTQERRGFSYLYCKRKVLEDGIHTEPLDITLCPLPSQEQSDKDLIDLLASNFED